MGLLTRTMAPSLCHSLPLQIRNGERESCSTSGSSLNASRMWPSS